MSEAPAPVNLQTVAGQKTYRMAACWLKDLQDGCLLVKRLTKWLLAGRHEVLLALGEVRGCSVLMLRELGLACDDS